MHRRLSVSGAPTSGRLLLLLPAITAESSVAKRFNFPRIQQPFDDGMNASQKILLRRQTKGFNSPFDFSRGQPFLSAHEDGADGVCNAINKACGSAGFLVFVGKFGESGDLPLVSQSVLAEVRFEPSETGGGLRLLSVRVCDVRPRPNIIRECSKMSTVKVIGEEKAKLLDARIRDAKDLLARIRAKAERVEEAIATFQAEKREVAATRN